MDNFVPNMSNALSERESEVINLSNISIPPPRPVVNRLLCRVFSKRGYNPKQFKNFISTQWVGRFEHLILCPPSVLQNASMDTYTITPFWIQVYRMPFLSKSEALAKILGNMIGTFLEVHDDSLNEGWGPFLRMRVGIDVSKPLLRGQLVSFPWMDDELWLDFRYERLPEFCYECDFASSSGSKDKNIDKHITNGYHELSRDMPPVQSHSPDVNSLSNQSPATPPSTHKHNAISHSNPTKAATTTIPIAHYPPTSLPIAKKSKPDSSYELSSNSLMDAGSDGPLAKAESQHRQLP
uniref:Zinc knuckle CX2CX4HX4C domain-containing protein n=1 Tax=Cannabis sativa TaxID=3483 RepID=A0A803QQQ0_CANSA